ncbi:MAG: hypothetical protein H6611_01960 [Ignavibacteriales bacterium]|nr:hypothetical protein [Ignavibacteriales bacterium]
MAIIIISANYLVDSASNIARYFGISEWLIEIAIVAEAHQCLNLELQLLHYKKKSMEFQ